VSIGRNATYNLLGFLVPSLLGLIAVPIYLALIGTERFGVMALAWLVLGYFGMFDLGLGRATAQRIAALRDAGPEERTTALGTSLAANLAIGTAGAALLYPVGWYLFGHVFDLTPAMRVEAVQALPLLVIALPIATTVGVLSGALMGREKFLEINRISVLSTALFQFLPLAVAWMTGPELPIVMAAAIAARLIGIAMLWRACRREFGPVRRSHWDSSQLRRLLSFGGWVTLTAIFGPLLVFSDRFLIGSMIGAVAVTIYTIPLDAMRRLTGAAQALANALFPRLALAHDKEAAKLSRSAVGVIYAAFTPIVAAGLVVMDPAMHLWLGQKIGGEAAPLARLFLIATWLNCFALVPFARLQAQGRPDIVAKVHVAETPFYLLALWIALDRFGLTGAAWVYLCRIAADTLLLCFFANRRVEYWPLLTLTTALFCFATVVLNDAGALSLVPAIGWAIAAGAVFMAPAFAMAGRHLSHLRAR
jgi:O-antigen/teichoic acid export membrane protein